LLQKGRPEADIITVTRSADLLLAHGLFPEFPSLGVLLLILLVGGAGFACLATRRSTHLAGDGAPSEETGIVASSGKSWLRIPVVTLVACGVAAPLWLVPGIGVIAGIVLMPGWIVLWILVMTHVLPDHSETMSFVMMAAVSWVVWTASAMTIARIVAALRGDPPSHSTITSTRYH
jgi:hypothetical protein